MEPIWRPSPARVMDSNISQFVTSLRHAGTLPAGADGVPLPYGVLHEWSVRNPEVFWRSIASFCGLIADDFDSSRCFGLDRMAPPDARLGAKWFDGATLNFAENLLRHCDDRPAIVSWNERGRQQQLSFAELRGEVSRIASALRDMGIGVGDRVAGYLPNIPDPWRFNHMKIILGTGEWDNTRHESFRLSQILNAKGIHHLLDDRKWCGHDWNYWRDMLPHYLSMI